MKSNKYFQYSLFLPVLVPLLFLPVYFIDTEISLKSDLVFYIKIFLAGSYIIGIPYLIFVAIFWHKIGTWSPRQSIIAGVLSPIVLSIICGVFYFLGITDDGDSAWYLMKFILAVGYFYVIIVLCAFFIGQKFGIVSAS